MIIVSFLIVALVCLKFGLKLTMFGLDVAWEVNKRVGKYRRKTEKAAFKKLKKKKNIIKKSMISSSSVLVRTADKGLEMGVGVAKTGAKAAGKLAVFVLDWLVNLLIALLTSANVVLLIVDLVVIIVLAAVAGYMAVVQGF